MKSIMRLVQHNPLFFNPFHGLQVIEFYLRSHIITQSCIIDSRTFLHNVCCEKSYGSDGGIHANCCIPDAQANGEHRYVHICLLDSHHCLHPIYYDS